MKFTILSKDNCSLCQDAEKIAIDKGFNYEVKKVDKETLYKLCNKKVTGYPQILINDSEYLGDFFDFQEYDIDPLLNPTLTRFTVFPIKYPTLWDLYKKAQMTNWTAEEIDFGKDLDDWSKMSDSEKFFIKHVIAFFASSDGIVFENINSNFAKEIQAPEARSFYAYQEHNEMVHGETYSLMIDKYVTDPIEKENTFKAIETIPCIKQKAEWAMKWFNKSESFTTRLIAFLCVEGIFFSGSFCAIFWLKKRGLMPGLSFSNELISRDEALHQEFALELLRLLKNKPEIDMSREIITDAVKIEKDFIVNSLPCKLIGMDSEKMSNYIEFVADRIMKQLGFAPIWGTPNPFDFMENIALEGRTNFFEKRVGEYSKFVNEGDITFDADF